jgi:site-specific recombinase XerD
MRLSEIINIKWSAINLSERTIIVQNNENFTTKSKKERMIPINNTLATVLNNHIPKVLNINFDEYVFYKYSGVPYLKDYISKNFKKVIRKLEMNDRIHFHSLRHSAASNMVQAGVSLYVVKEILGHEDLSTTQIYSHLQKENLISAVKTLDNHSIAC